MIIDLEATIAKALGDTVHRGPEHWYPNYVDRSREYETPEIRRPERINSRDDGLLEAYRAHKTYKEIGRQFGMSKTAVGNALYKLRCEGRLRQWRMKHACQPLSVRYECRSATVRKLCEALGVDPGELVGPGRESSLVGARYAIAWHLHVSRGLGFSYIGRRMNRDHATVMHGVNRVKADPAKYMRWTAVLEGVALAMLPLNPVEEEG